ncbi:diacylglycerol/lipid kinase family protein [Mycobacterium angelicum]|uniref:Diacylglycerol kinase n=1 Tax=Mycobacterium angelicum TaxID=470074 RepID=A0A1X0A8V8_MYCAN|nr:diacylglycerol kinase family protein [Mycobacterium angelicum]MCV7197579.1 diacylglycerol kinase family lipid kinase [Mycobacterium angelicum]ORA26462.1 diacylglycerol kinase [Mycobacterium angelicum]
MRAVLIVNPTATTITPAARDLVAHALKSRVQLTIEHTKHRGHGAELGQAAVADGVDLVVVHGGDGTVSGVVNGMLGSPATPPQGPIPAVAIVPGGSANVLARVLGIARDPIAATNQLIGLLDDYDQHRQWRRIGLIDCGERWAVFNTGMGVDAEVVAGVEAERDKGGKVSAWRYIRTAVPLVYGYTRREPALTLELPGREPITGVSFVFVSNASPWTYANERPVWTNPTCSFERGLGVFAPTTMKLIPTLRIVRQMFAKRPRFEFKHLVTDDDVPWVRVTATAGPAACQFDGDYLGQRETMTFRAVPDVLPVVAPLAKSVSDQG